MWVSRRAEAIAKRCCVSASRISLQCRSSEPRAVPSWRHLSTEASAYVDIVRDAVDAQVKLQGVSSALSSTQAVDATTHEGMMRLLQQKQIKLPDGILSPNAMAGLFKDGAGSEVIQRGFPWSEHEYLDGHETNARMLHGFESEFAAKTGTRPPEWRGLEMALDDPENLRAALDLSVAYIKNYQLDKCEVLLGRYALPACQARGLPWIAKGLQDYATLRMKQNRQAEAMLLLEELESMLPPHPIMLHNLGLAYNSMRMHDKAMDAFERAVVLNRGVKAYDDYWNIGITLKHMKNYKDAFLELIKALELAPGHPSVDDVTLAKLHDTLGSCLQKAAEGVPEEDTDTRMGLAKKAEPYFREAVELYRGVIGSKHHLYGGACHLLAKNLTFQGRTVEAEPILFEAMSIESLKDGLHPTPCHEMLTELLDLHERGAVTQDGLKKYHDVLRVMIMHLHTRGFLVDGNGGVVMQAVAKILLLSGQELARPALALLRKGVKLVENHVDDVTDTTFIQLMMRIDIKKAENCLALPPPSGNSPALQSEMWLLEGPWGATAGSEATLGLCLPSGSS